MKPGDPLPDPLPDEPDPTPNRDGAGWTSADESLFRSLNPPPPESEAELFARLDRFESGPFTSHLALLENRGYVFPPPEEIDDEAIHRELWRLIHALAEIHVLVEGDGHLDDRALYSLLWREQLREPVADLTDDAYGAWHLECHPEYDTLAYVQYYGTEQDRAEYAEAHGLHSPPANLPLPHDRESLKPSREDLLPPVAEGEEDDWMELDFDEMAADDPDEDDDDEDTDPGDTDRADDWKKA